MGRKQRSTQSPHQDLGPLLLQSFFGGHGIKALVRRT
jgi:hypothetical protein